MFIVLQSHLPLCLGEIARERISWIELPLHSCGFLSLEAPSHSSCFSEAPSGPFTPTGGPFSEGTGSLSSFLQLLVGNKKIWRLSVIELISPKGSAFCSSFWFSFIHSITYSFIKLLLGVFLIYARSYISHWGYEVQRGRVHPQKLKASEGGRTVKRQVRAGVTGQSEQAVRGAQLTDSNPGPE